MKRSHPKDKQKVGENSVNSITGGRATKRLHKNDESFNGTGKNKKINHFNRLPDELVARIFKHLCRSYKQYGSYYLDKKDESQKGHHYWFFLNNLAMTCRRFNYVINCILLADIEFAKLASLELQPVDKSLGYLELCRCNLRFAGRPDFFYKEDANYEEPDDSIWEYTKFDRRQLPPCESFCHPEGLPKTLYTRTLKKRDFKVKNKPPFWCDYTDEDDCDCRDLRKELEQCKLKYRYLKLYDIDLFKNCIPKFIQDKQADLNWVVQLNLMDCEVDSVIINNILRWLPRIEKLSIRPVVKEKESDVRPYIRKNQRFSLRSNGAIEDEEPPVRVLTYLYFEAEIHGQCGLLQPVANVPAKIVHGDILDCKRQLSSVRSYLLRHRANIEHFRFRMGGEMKGWRKYFDGFSVTGSPDDRENFVVNSSQASHLDMDNMLIRPDHFKIK